MVTQTELVLQELDNLGVVLVASAGNVRNKDVTAKPQIDKYPALWAGDGSIPNLIVVGASDKYSRAALFSQRGPALTVWAPGQEVMVASSAVDEYLRVASGTSYLAPMVAALMAYWRAHDNDWLAAPSDAKAWLQRMSRRVQTTPSPGDFWEFPYELDGNNFGWPVSPVWNGMISAVNCILDVDDEHCPGNPNLFDDPTPLDDLCGFPSGTWKRQSNGFCGLNPGQGGGGGSGDGGNVGGQDQLGPSKTFTYLKGTPSPTCTSGCGTLCTDFWCRPDRTGQPLHFTEPTRLPTTTPTPSGGGGGGGGDGGGGSIPTNCISSTTTQSCNGLGEFRSCHPSTVCLATATPTASTPSSADCTTNTECFGAKGGPTTVTTCVSSSSCSGSPCPTTATPLSGFPSPSPIPGVVHGCMNPSECDAHPGLSMACDAAAEEFTGAFGFAYTYGTGALPSWVCRTGFYLSLTRGGTVGCRIKFERLNGAPETDESVCRWHREEARQWYSNMRTACRDEGYACGAVQMINWDTSCAMTIEYVSSCPGLIDLETN